MNIKIEKINKIKAFEPFECKIPFDNVHEVREIIKEMKEVEDLPNYDFLVDLKEHLEGELKKQGFNI